MANNWVLPEQETAFALHPDYGLYFAEIYPPVFALVEGESYTVRWDGVKYTCQAGPMEFMGMTFQVVGNKALLGGEDTGEPFGIGSVSSDGVPASNVMATTDTADSHTVGIALGEIREPGILLADHTGEQVNYGFPDRLRVDTSEGETEDYVRSGLLPEAVEKTVALDFSAGAMAVTPEEGQVFSGVKIPVPANLLAENIAEGVNIAGVIGALVAGGGGGSGPVVFASGEITPSANTEVISHNLGVVPDIAAVIAEGSVTVTLGVLSAYNFSTKLIAAGAKGRLKATSFSMGTSDDSALDTPEPAAMGWLTSATETTMSIGSLEMARMQPSIKYHWFAIGGLT